jgi:hypothetical protein
MKKIIMITLILRLKKTTTTLWARMVSSLTATASRSVTQMNNLFVEVSVATSVSKQALDALLVISNRSVGIVTQLRVVKSQTVQVARRELAGPKDLGLV